MSTGWRSARPTSCGSAARSCARSPVAMTTPLADGVQVNIPRASRKDVRDAVAAARKAFGPWSARTAYNRGQILYRAAEALESRPISWRRSSDRDQVQDARRRARALRRLDRQVPAPCSAASTRSRRRSCRSRCPSRPAWSASSRPTSPRCSAWSPRSRPRWPPATPSSRSCRNPSPWPAWTSPRCWASPTSPPASSTSSPAAASELAGALGAHRDLNAIVDAAGDAELAAELDRLAAETIKRVRHGVAVTSYDTAIDDALERIDGAHRAEDGLASDRRVAAD